MCMRALPGDVPVQEMSALYYIIEGHTQGKKKCQKFVSNLKSIFGIEILHFTSPFLKLFQLLNSVNKSECLIVSSYLNS